MVGGTSTANRIGKTISCYCMAKKAFINLFSHYCCWRMFIGYKLMLIRFKKTPKLGVYGFSTMKKKLR